MYGRADTSAIFGIEGRRVVVEADFGDGLPEFDMVGFLGNEVREARERVRSALKNAGVAIPPGKLTVNLSPANLKKQGNAFDLAIAVAVLVAVGVISEEAVSPYHFVGELSLDGVLRPVTGALSHVILSRELKKQGIVLPLENALEASVFEDQKVYPMRTLPEVIAFLNDPGSFAGVTPEKPALLHKEGGPDFSDVFGQESVKRAAAVASAGMHAFLMIGPPGTGKTLTARRIPTILPPLTEKEKLECTKIYSVAGLLKENAGLVTERPFRSPHHTVSLNGLIGGGSFPKPGELSLAHNGVLFLDELGEYPRQTLDAMRIPLEDKQVVISRVQGSYVFPTRVMLVLAMNPCACGYYPDRNKCHCTESDVRKYLSKISKPLLDRVDISVEVPAISKEDLEKGSRGKSSADLRAEVVGAWEIQKERYKGEEIVFNSELDGARVRKYCVLSAEGKTLLREAFEKMSLSLRAYDRILKVSRTIADLDGRETIDTGHVAEAVSYRSVDRKYWR